jgi:hypothetical protein
MITNQRNEFSETEKEQSKLLMKFLEQRRERFNNADTHLWMAQNQNQNDLMYISNSFFDWQKGLKPESEKSKVLENMILTMFRIESYCRQTETVSKSSVSEYISERKTNEKLESEIKLLKLQMMQKEAELKSKINLLEKEIEFQNNTSIK